MLALGFTALGVVGAWRWLHGMAAAWEEMRDDD